nr:LysR substrate-binding domain-containing protein [Ancylobacter crimeensis]
MPALGALRAFEAAARLGSFKRASVELAVTPTAISHQIRQLEADLGVALFLRQTRKVVLTEEGRALYEPVHAGFTGIAAVVGRLRAGRGRKVATLSATLSFTARLLVPRAARFRARFPDWDLRLNAADANVDLAAGEADAAIRYGAGPWPGLDAVELMPESFAPVCAPQLGIRTPRDLARATLIHIEPLSFAPDASAPSWRAYAEASDLPGIEGAAGVTVNDENSAIQAVLLGQGVALLSLALMSAELAAGTLVEPFGCVMPGLAYHFVAPAGAAARPGAAVLRDWVVAEFGEHRSIDHN